MSYCKYTLALSAQCYRELSCSLPKAGEAPVLTFLAGFLHGVVTVRVGACFANIAWRSGTRNPG